MAGIRNALVLGIFLFLLAALLMGCPQKPPEGGERAGGSASLPNLQSSDVPAYNDTLDSDIGELAKELEK